MKNYRNRISKCALIAALLLGACGKSEPDIPTWDPLDKISTGEGWGAGKGIAVSPGKDSPTAHHVQTIASGLHDIDFASPPKALISVTPSCKVTKPSVNSGKYLIVGDGQVKYPLIKNADPTSLVTFDNNKVNALGKKQARQMVQTELRTSGLSSRIELPAFSMAVKDVFITELSEPVAVALGGGGLYNFHLSPGVRLTGVVVYTGETGYNKSMQAAVAGVPDGVPVNFVNEKHKTTKGCWTRVQNRPDKSWSKNSQRGLRFDALEPHWKRFYRRVRNDFGDVPQKNVLSVSAAGHYLIGPPPARYEDRIPYVAFNGKTIHYSEADYVNFGTYDQNQIFARKVLDQYYESHLEAARK